MVREIIRNLTDSPRGGELRAVLRDEYKGRLPIRIWAAHEHRFYAGENILARVEAADERFVFLPDLLTPLLIRAIWYPSTVATVASRYSQLLSRYLEKTSDHGPSFSRFMLYGFGQRSASSQESAVLGGAAALEFFEFTDIGGARDWLKDSYGRQPSAKALKTLSLDHGRYLLLEEAIRANPIQFQQSVFEEFDIFSLPVDSTSLEQMARTLRALVGNVPEGKNLILRWDGSALEPVIPKLLEILKAAGEPALNKKGFLSWSSNTYLMFTENMTLARVEAVLGAFTARGYTVDRLLFGTGTQMLQQVSRDDFGVVGKITGSFDGENWNDVEKKSLDQPQKRGLAGRLSLSRQGERWVNERTESTADFPLIYGPGV